jgi:hypothetical protein
MKRKTEEPLNVAKVMEDFQKAEASTIHRKDAFKIEGRFEDAVRKIAKVKPGPKKPSK